MPDRITIEFMISHLPFEPRWKEAFLKKYPTLDPWKKSITTDVMWDLWDAVIAICTEEIKRNKEMWDKYSEHTGKVIAPSPKNVNWEELAIEFLENYPNDAPRAIIRSSTQILQYTMGFR